jgi:hypothetical protein
MRVALFIVFIGGLSCGLPVLAATPDELRCQARIDASKRSIEVAHEHYVAWQQNRDEVHRCAFLGQSRTQFRVVKEMVRVCAQYLPDARSELDRMNTIIRRIDIKGGCSPSGRPFRR